MVLAASSRQLPRRVRQIRETGSSSSLKPRPLGGGLPGFDLTTGGLPKGEPIACESEGATEEASMLRLTKAIANNRSIDRLNSDSSCGFS